mmetsp:Transcript_3282/g.5451  ORF Transcript_3282/g.5451 Transcript_3282/m.5451 type:complete len:143 (+) Transcript_3282:894-1322(+)
MDKFGKKVPRSIDVYIPQITEDGLDVTYWQDTDARKANISREYIGQQRKERGQTYQLEKGAAGENETGIMFFKSKNGSLDYQGKSIKESKKNFQLVDEFDESKIYLQFARTSDQTFSMDVAYPFSIFQAFAICLSTFDTKFN